MSPKTRTNPSFGCSGKLTKSSDDVCVCEAKSVVQGQYDGGISSSVIQWAACSWESCPKAVASLWFSGLVSSGTMPSNEGGVQAVVSL